MARATELGDVMMSTMQRVLLALTLLLTIISVDIVADADYLHDEAEAQIADDILRVVSRAFPSTSRRLSRQAKGEIGEENIEQAIRVLGRQADEVLEVERLYLRKGALDHGIDGLYRNVSRSRFNAVEAKATTSTEMLYEGILGNTSVGRQMDTPWIRKSLREATEMARRVADNPSATAAERRAARQILSMVDEIDARALRQTDRTLVVTRLVGVDGTPGVGRTVHPNLARHFDNIIEVDRNGRVLLGGVYRGSRR
jgi:hypothetical protein